MERPYFVIDVFTNERFAGNPAAVVTDARGLSIEQMGKIAAEFNLSETTFIDRHKGTKARRHAGAQSRPMSVPARRERHEGCREHEITNYELRTTKKASCGIGEADPISTLGRSDLSAFRFRWFTPKVEVSMCGHATIAGVHALVEETAKSVEDAKGRKEDATHVDGEAREFRIETKSGVLTAWPEKFPGPGGGQIIWLELRPPALEKISIDVGAFARVLRLDPEAVDRELPPARTQDGDLLFFVRDALTVQAANPDFVGLAALLEKHRCRGVSLASVRTLAPSIAIQSRFFAPCVGINEDPVTGSVHGPLAVHLVLHQRVPVHDDEAAMMCVQGTPGGRAGLVYALVKKREGDWSVRIGGQAVTVMRGTIVV